MRRNRERFGWLLAVLGALFLVAGLVVLLFATVPLPPHAPLAPQPEPSAWVGLANMLMNFILALLQVHWTPPRVGVFLIIIGLLLEGGAAFLLLTPPRRRR